MPEFEYKFRVELKPNEPRTRIDLPRVPFGELRHIIKAVCLDKPSTDFELALWVNETRQTGISASTLLSGKESAFFSNIGLSSGSLAHFVATPLSTVTDPMSIGFVLRSRITQSRILSK